ncbi:MAG: hypothetical protein CM1200mP10_22430 [Candidatus Neomarinimicrobiota bacterium]|nr:MAG: hypothetical protein CM1200mP10_22430 [Candidatus Neomarinimicrobiota bacterium]
MERNLKEVRFIKKWHEYYEMAQFKNRNGFLKIKKKGFFNLG